MKILVISNMYPNKKNPSYGIFVKRFCEKLEKINIDYDLSVMKKSNTKLGKIFRYIVFFVITFFKCLLNEYDYVYVHYASISSIPVIYAYYIKNKKIKLITNVHGSDVVPENNKQKKLQKYTKLSLELSKWIIVPSDYFKEYVKNKYNIEDKKIKIYPSAGIDSKMFYKYSEEKKASIISKLKLDSNKLKICYVGRISHNKGWDTFVKAIDHLKAYNKYQFIIVGDGHENNQLVDFLKLYNLNDIVVRFPLLKQEELADIYNSIDCLVFPTKREGESLGLVGLESMACGTPIIASNYAAPSYYVRDKENGFKFKVGDEVDLALAITKFERLDKMSKEKMSINAISTASKYYVKNIQDKLIDIFNNS